MLTGILGMTENHFPSLTIIEESAPDLDILDEFANMRMQKIRDLRGILIL